MARSIASLTLSSLVLHEVPKAWKHSPTPAAPLVYSQTHVPMTSDQKKYMQERLHKSLSIKGQAREVQEMENHTSPVPDILRALLTHPQSNYIVPSQNLADHLRNVQDGGSPAGLFLFARCQWNRQPSVLVAKVELERGIQVKQTKIGGLDTYDMTLLKDLVFGQTSKVFKVGLFSVEDLDVSTNRLRGIAIDQQVGGSDVAQLFLLHYLGCEFVANAAQVTKVFFDSSTEFFTNNVADPIKKSEYVIALVSELKSRKTSINPTAFAREHLDDDDQDRFLNYLGNSSVPLGSFTKSMDYIPTNLIQYETETNIVIIATHEDATRSLEVRRDSILVKGGIKKVGTRGPKGAKPPKKQVDPRKGSKKKSPEGKGNKPDDQDPGSPARRK